MPALEYANKLKTKFGDLISEPTEFRGEITVKLDDAEQITEICRFAKLQLGFDYLCRSRPAIRRVRLKLASEKYWR